MLARNDLKRLSASNIHPGARHSSNKMVFDGLELDASPIRRRDIESRNDSVLDQLTNMPISEDLMIRSGSINMNKKALARQATR